MTRRISHGAALAAALLGTGLVLARPAAGQEDSIDAALAAYERGRFERALGAFARALARGRNEPDDLFIIHRGAGLIRVMMGDREGAAVHFRRALALRPDALTPSELAPPLAALFESLRARAQRVVLEVEVETASTPTGHVTVRVRGGPEGWAARARVSSGAWRQTVTLDPDATLEVPAELRQDEALELSAEALDEHGNIIATARHTHRIGAVALGPVAPAGPAGASSRPEGVRIAAEAGGSVLEEAWFWIVVATAVTAAVTIPIALELTAEDVFVVGGFSVRE